jgi:hypothetical protein
MKSCLALAFLSLALGMSSDLVQIKMQILVTGGGNPRPPFLLACRVPADTVVSCARTRHQGFQCKFGHNSEGLGTNKDVTAFCAQTPHTDDDPLPRAEGTPHTALIFNSARPDAGLGSSQNSVKI